MFQLADLDAIAFSGSRNGCPPEPLQQAFSRIRPGTEICVGCARGVDEQVRAIAPQATIFNVKDYDGPTVAARLANRSAAMVEYTNGKNGGLIAFPMKECPPMVKPCKSWQYSGGSGTWGTIALATGLGMPVVIWLPEAIAPPQWEQLEKISTKNWYLCLPF